MSNNENDQNDREAKNETNSQENETTEENPGFRYKIFGFNYTGTGKSFNSRLFKNKIVNKEYFFGGIFAFALMVGIICVILIAHLFAHVSETNEQNKKVDKKLQNEISKNSKVILEHTLKLIGELDDYQITLDTIQNNSFQFEKAMELLKDRLYRLEHNSEISDKDLWTVINILKQRVKENTGNITNFNALATDEEKREHADFLNITKYIQKRCGYITNYISSSEKELRDKANNVSQSALHTLEAYDDELSCLANRTSAIEMPSAPCHQECNSITLVDYKDNAANYEGAVEVTYQGEKRFICDDIFGENNNGAQVICRMLGYSQGGSYSVGTKYVRRYDFNSYWLDDIRCRGDEGDITQCRHAPWGSHNCRFGEIAGVTCTGKRSTSGQYININALEHLLQGSSEFRRNVLHQPIELVQLAIGRFDKAKREIVDIEHSLYSLKLKSNESIELDEYDGQELAALSEKADALLKDLSKMETNLKDNLSDTHLSIDNVTTAATEFLNQQKANIDCLKSASCGLCSNNTLCSQVKLTRALVTIKFDSTTRPAVLWSGLSTGHNQPLIRVGHNRLARVVCKMIGYPEGGYAIYGYGSLRCSRYSSVFVTCSGDEVDISDCVWNNARCLNNDVFNPIYVECLGEPDLSGVCKE